MRTRRDGSTPAPPSPSSPPSHAFTPEYLELLSHRDEPVTASEADVAGPWHLEQHAQGWAVLRRGESLEKGSRPMAVFAKRGDLAWVIDAAGGLALDHAGKIALERALA